METTSIGRLLEVGHFLYQLQNENNCCLFYEEIELILNAVFQSLDILISKGRFEYVVNTDHYEQVMTAFFQYCRKEWSHAQVMKVIDALFQKKSDHVVNLRNVTINTLFNIKYTIQTNRSKGNHDICMLKAERKILNYILEELGQKTAVANNDMEICCQTQSLRN